MYSGFSARQRVSNVSQVDSPNSTWVNQEPHWELIEALLLGTYGIRGKHRRFLPQEPRETDLSYQNRLNRSVLAPYYMRLERMLAGMLTRKPVRLDDVPDVIREQLFDADLQGNDLQTWLFQTARVCLRYGHVGVLVDAPAAGENGRPYFVTYSPRDIIGFRYEPIDGKQQLTQLRLAERIVVPDGKYGEKEVEQIRVLTPGAFEIHQRNKQGEFEVVDDGRTSLSEIPFSVAYSNRVGLLQSLPPLADIAELNLQHYQVQSDLSNQLHISAVSMLAIYGFPQLSAETAEAKRIDRSQGDSTMMVVAQQMQDLIDNCLRFQAEYMQERTAGSSLVNRDFMGIRLDPQEIQALLQLYTAGTITQETLLLQLEAGEVLGDDFDVEEEIEATQAGGLIEMNQPEPRQQALDKGTMPEAAPEQSDELD